jgi:hypothetical protein
MRHPGPDPSSVLQFALVMGTVFLTPFVVTAAVVWLVSKGTRHLGRWQGCFVLLVTAAAAFAIVSFWLFMQFDRVVLWLDRIVSWT